MTSAPTLQNNTEKSLFEANLRKINPAYEDSLLFGLMADGVRYSSFVTQQCWLSWQARAAIQQAAGAVPEGWKLVPVEPTDLMTYRGQCLRYTPVHSMGAIYRAMLAAAPEFRSEIFSLLSPPTPPASGGSSDHLAPRAGGGVTQPASDVALAAETFLLCLDGYTHACHVDGETPGGADELRDAAEQSMNDARYTLVGEIFAARRRVAK